MRESSSMIHEKYLDLHLHLDGAITVPIAKELAQIQEIQLPEEDDEALKKRLTVPPDCKSLNDFLTCFALPGSLMQTKTGLTHAVKLVGDEIASQGVIYAEIRFAPQLHTDKGMTQEDAILAAIDGVRAVSGQTHINLILCCMRGEGNEACNDETVELAKKYLVRDGGVVAVDLAGAEALFPTKRYRELFSKVRDYGMPFTIHAGEADGADSVRLAIEYGADRIGHGVRAYEDEELLRILVDKGVTLEMCPTSNRQTHAVEDMSRYPLMEYLRRGIRVTLNTDDPGIEGTTIADEFRYMEEQFGLTREDRQTMLMNSISAAFTTDEVKAALREKII